MEARMLVLPSAGTQPSQHEQRKADRLFYDRDHQDPRSPTMHTSLPPSMTFIHPQHAQPCRTYSHHTSLGCLSSALIGETDQEDVAHAEAKYVLGICQ